MKRILEWFFDHEGTIFLVITVSGLLAVFVGILAAVREEKEHEVRASQYLIDHKCVTVSYAGKYADPVYQCDNGLVMRKQIP